MLPIRDINPRVRVPIVNYALLALTAAVFLFQLSLGRDIGAVVETFAFVPARLHRALETQDHALLLAAAQTVLSSLVLHGGWFHVIGNLLYLRVFGDNIEDRFGHAGFFIFYVLSGFVGAIGQYLADPTSTVPIIGASGAIAGVLGAYVVLFPAARVVTLFPVFIFLTFIEVPAFLFLGIWAAQQLLNGYLTIVDGASDGVAWFTHLGGFALGIVVGLLARLLRARKNQPKAKAKTKTTE